MGLTQITTGGVDDNINIDSNTLKVDGSNNRVGIGTASPAYNLSVESSSGTSINIKAGTSSTARLRFGDSDDDDIGQIMYDNGGNSMRFHTNGSERLRIDSSGNVGIGNATPATLLDIRPGVTGAINAITMGYGRSANPTDAIHKIRWASDDLIIEADSANTIASNIQFRNDGTEYMRIDSSGRLLIGESSAVLDTSNALLQMGASEGANLVLYRDDTTVNNDSSLGLIRFYSNAGSNKIEHARISGIADGTSGGVNGAPGRLVFYTEDVGSDSDPVERMRIDSSGRVGIGTSSPALKLHVDDSGSQIIRFSRTGVGAGSLDVDSSGNAVLNSHTTGQSVVFHTQATERMRIDSSGRLLVGTTSNQGGHLFQVKGGDASLTKLVAASGGNAVHMLRFRVHNANNTSQDASLGGISAETVSGWGGTLTFHTKNANGSPNETLTERMRIDHGGTQHNYRASSGTVIISRTGQSGFSASTFRGYESASSITTGTVSFVVYANGNVQNKNNSYGQISDVKLKENIVDANSQWDDLKAFQIRNWNFKSETGYATHTQIGVVAQEIETVSPGLVYETPDRDDEGVDLGTVTKGVNYSVLYMKAVKALQEAMDRIETLEAKVAALEAAE